jgi:hypothetical protein
VSVLILSNTEWGINAFVRESPLFAVGLSARRNVKTSRDGYHEYHVYQHSPNHGPMGRSPYIGGEFFFLADNKTNDGHYGYLGYQVITNERDSAVCIEGPWLPPPIKTVVERIRTS